MNIKEITETLGGFGRYQWFVFLFVNVVNYLGAFSTLQHVFYAGTSDHWCTVFKSYNCSQYGLNTDAECQNAIKNVSIPPNEDYDPDVNYYYENCRQWNIPDGLVFSPDVDRNDYVNGGDKIACRNGEWTYDTSQYESTIIIDWNLVCAQKEVPNWMSSVFFFGYMAGSFIFGNVSDLFGRKPAIMCAMVVWFLGMLSTPFVQEVWQYYLVRFITGLGHMGRYISLFVLLTEAVPDKLRASIGVIFGVSYSLGIMSVALIAMAIREWRVLAFVPVIPLFLCLFITPFLNESIKWLLSKEKITKAEHTIRKIGKWNHREIPEDIFDEKEIQSYKDAAKGHVPNFIDLYRTPNMCFRTIDLQYNWLVNSMVYFGLSLSTSSLGADDYWTFFISGAVEIPAILYGSFGIGWFGKKFNMILLELIGGAACFSTFFIADDTAKLVVAMIGKFCITATLMILYVWTSELYPTSIRGVAVGMGSVAARVGGIAAPFMINLSFYVKDLHLVIFGCATILAGILLIPIPDTKNRNPPESLAESEELGKCDCMRRWRWKGYDSETNLDQSIEMDTYRINVVNPVFKDQDESHEYKARPRPQPHGEEKGCQFPEKPRKKSLNEMKTIEVTEF